MTERETEDPYPSDMVPGDVKSAAVQALNSPNKRVKLSIPATDSKESSIGSNINSGEIEADMFPTTELEGKQFQRHLDRIWEWLMGDEMSIMGVWGMAGVGKTALLKHINNKLHIHNHPVIWITVSQNYTIGKLQKAIAKSLHVIISIEDDDLKIGAWLLCAFEKMKNCVVILDDVWDHVSLKDVGIPLTNKDNGIRIIVASRLLDVCKSMGCKDDIIRVKPLGGDEAFTLFSKIHGDDVTLSNDIRRIAEDLTEECEGLPLAIVTIARSMRGKADIRVWRGVLSKLRRPEKDHDSIKRCVFPVLKSSFDHLNDRTVQDCFLCLPLCIEDMIQREDLKRIFADRGLINKRQHFLAQLDEGHIILNKLLNDNLLLEVERSNIVKLHKLMRAMAVNIRKQSHG